MKNTQLFFNIVLYIIIETVELGIIGKLDKAKKIFSSQERASISRVKKFFQRCIAELECPIQQSLIVLIG